MRRYKRFFGGKLHHTYHDIGFGGIFEYVRGNDSEQASQLTNVYA